MSNILRDRHGRLLALAIFGGALIPVLILWVTDAISAGEAALALGAALLLTVLVIGFRLIGISSRMSDASEPSAISGRVLEGALELTPSGGDELLMEGLEQLSRAAQLMTEPAQLYRWLTQRLADLFQAKNCALILRRLDDVEAFQVATPVAGLSSQELTQLRQWVEKSANQLSEMRDPIVLNRPSGRSRMGTLTGETNMMLVPMLIGDKRVGAIRLADKNEPFAVADAQRMRFLAHRLGVMLENSRLYQVARRRLDEMSLLYEVGIPLAGTLDFDEGVNRAVQSIQTVLGCEQVNVFLVDEDSEMLVLHEESPSPVSAGRNVRVPLGKGVVGRVAQTGEIAHLPDVDAKSKASWKIPGIRSEVCVPLKLGSWVIGVIDAQNSRPDAFEEKDVRLLGIVAQQLAAILQSARLFAATRQRAAELSLLYDATVAISTTELGLAGTIELVMKRLIAAVEVDGGRLALWDDVNDRFEDRYEVGSTLVSGVSSRDATAVGAYLRRHFVTSRKALIHYRDEAGLDRTIGRLLKKQKIQSFLVLPLVAHNRLIGMVELDLLSHRRARLQHAQSQLSVIEASHYRFRPDKVRLAQTLATQAAIALENTRLYQETKRAVEELAALQALALDITAQVTLPELMERLTMRARQLLDAIGSVIYLSDDEKIELTSAASDVPWQGAIAKEGLKLAREVVKKVRPTCQVIKPSPMEGDSEPPPPLSCASVPLRWREQVVGVMSVLRPEATQPFAERELYLLELLAPQAAIAILNVQLYEVLEIRMQELERAQAGLVQAEKAAAIGRLAASLAHEINNPLQSLNNCLHLSLRPDLPPEKQGEFLQMAQEEVERLMAIVNRMLNFYRPATGEQRSETDVNQLLDDVLALVNRQLENCKVDTRLDLSPDLPAIMAVPNNLRQVFLNVVLNALDAMPEGGLLSVSTRRLDGKQVGVTITDTGHGIPPEHISQIYEPFFTTRENGTGLGLAISYGIIEAHNGRIQVDSVEGEGTTFLLAFPVGGERNE